MTLNREMFKICIKVLIIFLKIMHLKHNKNRLLILILPINLMTVQILNRIKRYFLRKDLQIQEVNLKSQLQKV